MAGYSRDTFPHWSSHGDKCDTRETVLQLDGSGVERDDQCRATSGSWVSVYDGKTFTDASDLGRPYRGRWLRTRPATVGG